MIGGARATEDKVPRHVLIPCSYLSPLSCGIPAQIVSALPRACSPIINPSSGRAYVQVPLPPAWPRGMCRRRSIRGWKDRAACRSRGNLMHAVAGCWIGSAGTQKKKTRDVAQPRPRPQRSPVNDAPLDRVKARQGKERNFTSKNARKGSIAAPH